MLCKYQNENWAEKKLFFFFFFLKSHYLWGGGYVMEVAEKGYIGYTNCTSSLAEVK
jgi:hypothetical protein